MAFAPDSTYFTTGDSSIIGCFVEKDCGNLFEFSKNLGETDYDKEMLDAGFEHLVWVNSFDPSPRYAKVLKTRCHIMTGEDDQNETAVSTWHFKKCNIYPGAEA